MTRNKVIPQEWREYLELIAPARWVTQNQFVATVLQGAHEDIKLDQTTVSHWRRGTIVPPRGTIVSAVGVAFKREPLEALVAAGIVDIDWVVDSLSSNALATLKKIGITPTKKKEVVK